MKNYIRAIIFIIIFIILFCGIGVIFNPTGSFNEWYQSYSEVEFYKQKKDTMDYIYMGNSCVYTGVSPLEIYKTIGVTGYTLATPGQKTWASYYWAKEVFKYQKPKAIFLEVGEAFETREGNTELFTRRAIDSMKFSKNKLDMIYDPDFELSNYDKLSCIFPILRYHSRWTELNEGDFRKLLLKDKNTYLGFLINKDTKQYNGKFDKNGRKKYKNKTEETTTSNLQHITDEARKKLDKIVSLCKENNSELVLMKIPEPKLWTPEKNQAISDYAKENNLKFIDLNYDENVNINWKKDTYDAGDHLNLDGAQEVAKGLSNFIKNNFEIQDHRNDASYQEWNDRLLEYNKQKELKK